MKLSAAEKIVSTSTAANHSSTGVTQLHGGALAHSAALAGIVADQATEAYFAIDAAGRVTFMNRAAEEMIGWQASELVGQGLHDCIHHHYLNDSSSPANSECSLRCILRTGQSIRNHPDIFLRRDGTTVAVRWSLTALLENGVNAGAMLSATDMTEQRCLEAALQESEAQLRAIFNIHGTGVALADAESRLLQVNAAFCEITGYDEAELIGRSFLELTHPDDRPNNLTGFRNIAEGGASTYRVEKRYVRKDGRIVWVNVLANLVKDPSGRSSRTVALIQDVTNRKEAEEARKEAVERYTRHTRLFDGVASTTPDFVYLFDLQGRFVYANRRLLEVWGMPMSDAVGKTCRELGYEQWHHDMHMREIAQVIETKRPIKGEVPFKAPLTGVFGVYEYILTPVLSPEGEVELIAGTTRDVTERKQAEEAAHRSEERYRDLFTSMTEGFCVIEQVEDGTEGPVDFRFVEANPAFLHQSGIDAIPGKTIREVIPAEASEWIAIYEEVVRTGKEIHFVRELQTNHRFLEVYAYPVGSESKRQVSLLVRDVTERKRVEEALSTAKRLVEQHASRLEQVVAERTAKLRETVDELEHFSYTITHDMRAPLRAMQAFGEILTEEYEKLLDDAGKDYLRRIIEASKRMDRLITDSLNYSKTVQIELSLESIDPGLLVRGIVESYPQLQPPQADIEISAELPTIIANPAGLTQCFSNLLGNAVKFVEPGTVPRVRVWAEPRGAMVRIWVEDNGIGIPADQRNKLFSMFQRVTTKYEGTGVGLALVRKVVQKMRGTVGYESEPGQGSRFWVELPATAGPIKS